MKTKKDDILLKLYFHGEASYQRELDEVRRECLDLQRAGRVRLAEYESREIPSATTKDVEDRIRGLIPQRRGSIVATHGFPLPLSNSKKLNLQNTPVLLVSSSGKVEYVFPCLVGEKYYSVLEGVRFLRDHLPEMAALPGIMEDAITELLLHNLPEPGLTRQPRADAETSAGLADLVFRDRKGRRVVVEVEREATDSALGQILRLAGGYEKKNGLQNREVRAVIACIKIHEYVELGAKRAGVEIWRVPIELKEER